MENSNMKFCPHCDARIPAECEVCPVCGKKIRSRLGELTDAQIKRIRRPITIVLCIVVAIVLYFKYTR